MTHTDPLALPPEHDPGPGWGQSLSTGAAGLALLHIAYARVGLAGWDTAHRWVAAMTRSPVAAHPDACLFIGAPAVAFVLRAADQPAYTAALSTLDGHITALTRHRLDRAQERIERGQLPRLPTDEPSEEWPGGHANLGLAHGIAGPLTLMSTAMRRGITVSGQAAAIARICAELDRWRSGTGGRMWWPGMISPAERKTHAVRQPGPQRPSWCYGTPGLARAQQLAALALGDPQRQRRAEEALTGCITDEAQLAQLTDASLCHGWAGLVQTTRRAAADAGPDSPLATLRPHLHTRFAQHLHRHRPTTRDGLLDGAAGVELTRHTTADALPAARWDACLLIAPPILEKPQTARSLNDHHH